MRPEKILPVITICFAIGLGACSAQPEQKNARYPLKGKVVSVDKTSKLLTVDHQEIPGLMGAMTMPYPVKDAHSLESLTAGDEVTAAVLVINGSYTLDEIVVTKHAAPK